MPVRISNHKKEESNHMDIKHYVVVPAYGRDYATAEAALADWVKGKDFRISSIDRYNGSYISYDYANLHGLSVQIRFNKLRDVCVWPEPQVDEMNKTWLDGNIELE
jgi:hypothetical protein